MKRAHRLDVPLRPRRGEQRRRGPMHVEEALERRLQRGVPRRVGQFSVRHGWIRAGGPRGSCCRLLQFLDAAVASSTPAAQHVRRHIVECRWRRGIGRRVKLPLDRLLGGHGEREREEPRAALSASRASATVAGLGRRGAEHAEQLDEWVGAMERVLIEAVCMQEGGEGALGRA